MGEINLRPSERGRKGFSTGALCLKKRQEDCPQDVYTYSCSIGVEIRLRLRVLLVIPGERRT